MSAAAGITYVLPIRQTALSSDDDALWRYLHGIASIVAELIVVDGSPSEVFSSVDALLPRRARHLPVHPGDVGANGKASGVRTALRAVRTEYAIIADDDVRYDLPALEAVAAGLRDADIAIPQNYFGPLVWHAVLDEGRSLIARACGGDWPGTLGLRIQAYRRAGAYDANVLFENLELVRTIRAAGGRARRLDGVFVRRVPPSVQHYLGQRIRQAYDEFARPAALCAQLALLPLGIALARRWGVATVPLVWALGAGTAEAGRRRAHADAVFPFIAALLAPLWIAERSVTSWIALAYRLSGGVPYAGRRLRVAANPVSTIRRRAGERAAA